MDAELRDLHAADLPALTRLAGALFGRGDRSPDWLARKIAREGVDPGLSVLAVAPGAPEHVSEDMLLGYFLIGHEPGDPLAHSAGLGVRPHLRGRGLGPALVAAAVARLARRTCDRPRTTTSLAPAPAPAPSTSLRVLAEPDREGFYARLGFTVAARRVTLLTLGTGPLSPADLTRELQAHPPAPWSFSPTLADALEICAWRPRVWARTPDAATLTPRPGVWAHVSREGRAVLVQRLLVARELDPRVAVDALAARFPAGTPLLLYGAREAGEAVSSITALLLQHGLQPAQRFAEMDLPVRLLDNSRAGDR